MIQARWSINLAFDPGLPSDTGKILVVTSAAFSSPRPYRPCVRAEISPLANARSDPTVVWWLYVLACDGGVLYVGISPDPVKRFLDHQARKSRFSQMRRPRELLASLPIGPHLLAAREERRLKRQPVANKLEWVAIARQAPSWLRLVKKHGTAIFMASCPPDSAPSPHAQEIS